MCKETYKHDLKNLNDYDIHTLNSFHYNRFQFEYVPMSRCPSIKTNKLNNEKYTLINGNKIET
jgi:hypothetical protein